MKYAEIAQNFEWALVATVGETGREDVRWQWMGAGNGPMDHDGSLITPPWPDDVDRQGNSIPCA